MLCAKHHLRNFWNAYPYFFLVLSAFDFRQSSGSFSIRGCKDEAEVFHDDFHCPHLKTSKNYKETNHIIDLACISKPCCNLYLADQHQPCLLNPWPCLFNYNIYLEAFSTLKRNNSDHAFSIRPCQLKTNFVNMYPRPCLQSWRPCLSHQSAQSLTANTLELKRSEPKRLLEFEPCLKSFWYGVNSKTSTTYRLYSIFLPKSNVQKSPDSHFGTIRVPLPLLTTIWFIVLYTNLMGVPTIYSQNASFV